MSSFTEKAQELMKGCDRKISYCKLEEAKESLEKSKENVIFWEKELKAIEKQSK